LKQIYAVNDLPLFQNVVFETEAEALAVPTVRVMLEECESCGFVWNTAFDQSLMCYDKNYQNEQGHSDEFNKHLDQVVELLIAGGYKEKNIVEVGCGKGVFLNKLKLAGFRKIKGYDPAYEGDSKDIVADYFKRGVQTGNADLIVLRHVLEHIANPLEFLHTVAEANAYHGDIYIEVPDFDWIRREGAFWDIFNEHCNYFTIDSIKRIFNRSEVLSLFGEQYIGIFASLSDLKQSATTGHICNQFSSDQYDLNRRFEEYRSLLESNSSKKIVLWGAASKGVIFANRLDKDRTKIDYLIDINPKKQGKFIGGTGHLISPPPPSMIILVGNPNYLNEIKNLVNSNIEYITI
jgi:hypothetical protein